MAHLVIVRGMKVLDVVSKQVKSPNYMSSCVGGALISTQSRPCVQKSVKGLRRSDTNNSLPNDSSHSCVQRNFNVAREIFTVQFKHSTECAPYMGDLPLDKRNK